MTITLTSNTQINTFASLRSNINYRNAANVGVLLYSFDDPFISLIKQSLEDIQKKNENEVRFTFFDGKKNIAIQNETLDTLLKNNIDLLIVNLTDTRESIVVDVINKVKQKEVPLILINIDPKIISKVSNYYNKVIFIASDLKQSGIMQGKIIADAWNTNRKAIDKNGDNVLQYILLKGDIDSEIAKERTNYSLLTINDAGIKTKQLAMTVADWNKELTKNSMDALFLKYDDNIEAIIANNDTMAIGAIESLQKYGYNKENKSKYISVFGIDGIQEAKDLVDKGIMAGTVIQDPSIIAEAFYTIGMNLIHNVNPVENTNYKFTDGMVEVTVPYKEYIKQL
jgi:methyl-galactoside transport system substrate-binding protein